MATVVLRPPLRDLAGGAREVEVPGRTVAEVLRALERTRPRLAGWILDERGSVREHVALFVNGERAAADASVGPADRVQVLPAISGGEDPLELLVGTRKGLAVLRGPRGGELAVAARAFPGSAVEYAIRDRRAGRYLASVTHGQFGPRLYLADDPAGEWEQAEGPAFPEDAGAAVERIWVIQPGEEEGLLYAGVAPAALFRSEDGGRTWSLVRGLWDRPERAAWQPGAGGLCLHSVATWPGDPSRLAVAISAAGVWLTEDGGTTWRRGVRGLVPRYLPEEAREGAVDLCVHNLHRSPVRPTTLYLQFHGGVYRSDDAGETWEDIGAGLPSDFGFPLVVDPRDPDRAFVVPLVAAEDRVTPDGRVRVYETADAGASWRALTEGLPQEDAYLTVLRQAFCHDGRDPLGLYLGATSGEVFGSADGGGTWRTLARRLPPVLSVRAA
ncbi:MAG TPA: MoaD/ThiS family protein [Actinomycetota bacterium]|nr:MoaD/ThiS family protein [Actinomycetota bacterium]